MMASIIASLDQSRSESWSYLLETRYHDGSGALLGRYSQMLIF